MQIYAYKACVHAVDKEESLAVQYHQIQQMHFRKNSKTTVGMRRREEIFLPSEDLCEASDFTLDLLE